MPVNATSSNPAAGCSADSGISAATIAVSCADRNVFVTSQRVEPAKGVTLLRRLKTVTLPSRQPATIKHVLQTAEGQPVDLSDCSCDESSVSASSASCTWSLEFKMRESLSFNSECSRVTSAVTIVDAARGEVSIQLSADELKDPGVYFGQVSLVSTVDDVRNIVFSNMFYVNVSRSLSDTDGAEAVTGPPTMMEIRLFLRDTASEESYLLDNLRFGDDEIAVAIQLPLQQWNESPPRVGPQYTTRTFPHRYHWLIAITGFLFKIAAEQFRANNLQYNAAGGAVNDQNKEMNYETAADRRLAEWQKFMRAKKVEINQEMCWGTV